MIKWISYIFTIVLLYLGYVFYPDVSDLIYYIWDKLKDFVLMFTITYQATILVNLRVEKRFVKNIFKASTVFLGCRIIIEFILIAFPILDSPNILNILYGLCWAVVIYSVFYKWIQLKLYRIGILLSCIKIMAFKFFKNNKYMSKETESGVTLIKWQSVTRAAMTVIGSFLIGKNIFGLEVNDQLWESILGIVLSVISIVWSIKDKDTTIEAWQSVVRQFIQSAGGFLFAAGYINGQTLLAIIALIPVIAPYIQSITSRVKVKQIEEGKISTEQLKK